VGLTVTTAHDNCSLRRQQIQFMAKMNTENNFRNDYMHMTLNGASHKCVYFINCFPQWFNKASKISKSYISILNCFYTFYTLYIL